ncbi:MAG: rhomboid family intramembrane serine protease [Solirubrobacteraceae bacterium]
MSQPDLFVVCKNCQAEVSPYVTECPYCGMRVRKRAPKIERPHEAPPKPSRRGSRAGSRGGPKPAGRSPKKAGSTGSKLGLGRLRGGDIPGIRGDELAKPWATIVLVALSFGVWFSLVFYAVPRLALSALDGEPWLYLTATLLNDGTAAQLAVVVGLGLFGWLLERRHGPIAVVVLFLLCGPAALAIAVTIDPGTLVFGTHGAALGLLGAWLVPTLIARRGRSDDDDIDLLGVLVIAVVLLLVPVLSQGSALAGLIGAGLGALAGLAFAGLRARA